jgi:hypothetical protein
MYNRSVLDLSAISFALYRREVPMTNIEAIDRAHETGCAIRYVFAYALAGCLTFWAVVILLFRYLL